MEKTYVSTAEISRAVKKKLTAHFGKSVRVNKGRGTASHWVEAHIDIDRPADCFCAEKDSIFGNCAKCNEAHRQARNAADRLGQEAVDELGTKFSTYYSDDYSDPTPRDCYLVEIHFKRT